MRHKSDFLFYALLSGSLALAFCGNGACNSSGRSADRDDQAEDGIQIPDFGDTIPTTGLVKLDLSSYNTSTGMILDESTSGSSTNTMELPDLPPASICGDDEIDRGEECDGLNVNGITCQDFGYVGGEMLCQNCLFDLTSCYDELCGDNVKQKSEQCDCWDSCTPEQLGGKKCTDLSGLWGKFHGGFLACSMCLFDTTLCEECGDNEINGNEHCDGAALGGVTCKVLGFTGGGVLVCNPNCEFNTTGCKDAICGDGECTFTVENSCNCWNDCPDNPNTCSACECGGVSGNCSCLADCEKFEDCCGNKQIVCM